MRAKIKIESVSKRENCEVLKFHGVPAKSYPPDGLHEDNTFAKFSPCVAVEITVTNPALLGCFAPGETYYIDFTRTEA